MSVLRGGNCVQFLVAKCTFMDHAVSGLVDRAALERLIAASGVAVASKEIDAVARSLERIQTAAAVLMQSLAFDDAGERFYRLLGDEALTGRDR